MKTSLFKFIDVKRESVLQIALKPYKSIFLIGEMVSGEEQGPRGHLDLGLDTNTHANSQAQLHTTVPPTPCGAETRGPQSFLATGLASGPERDLISREVGVCLVPWIISGQMVTLFTEKIQSHSKWSKLCVLYNGVPWDRLVPTVASRSYCFIYCTFQQGTG